MTSTIIRSFRATVARAGDRPALRGRTSPAPADWTTWTWSEVDRARFEVAAALVDAGLAPGATALILSDSSDRWLLADLAIQSVGGVTVPVYPTSAPGDVAAIQRDSGARVAFVDRPDRLDRLDRAALDLVVAMETSAGPPPDGVAGWDAFRAGGRRVAAATGPEVDRRSDAVASDDLLTVIYTSGTTGRPKGVELTQANFRYEVEALEQIGLVRPDDVELLFLPLAHVFGRLLAAAWVGVGHELVVDADLGRIAGNLAEVRPHVVASVPRVFEKLYARIVGAGVEAAGLEGRLFSWAVSASDRHARCRLEGRAVPLALRAELAAARRIALQKVRSRLTDQLGDRLRFFISGGAPMPKRMAYFFENVGVTILEGYGLTETSAATCVNRPEDNRLGTVGPPLPGTEIRIADDGEILVRGPGVMRGYRGAPAATRDALSPDGWLATGDIGVLDHDNVLTITDRKKDLLVTAGGKNIAPRWIEGQLVSQSPLIGHVLLYGDRKKHLVALVALDREEAARFAAQHGLEDHAAVAASEVVHAEIQAAVARTNLDLARFETIKAFFVHDRPFEVGAELTPSLKLRRKACTERYGARLEALYDTSPGDAAGVIPSDGAA